MNLKSSFALVLLLAFFSSCSKKEVDDGLQGKWYLIKASGGIGGFSQEYEKGIITWEFTNDDKLQIINNYSGTQNFTPSTSTFNYQLLKTIEGTELYFDEKHFTNLSIFGDSIYTDNSFRVSDGWSFLLVR